MPLDTTSIQLPPPGAKLRLPPKNARVKTYEEVYQQVRRHLRDDEGGEMSVQMKAQINAGDSL